MDRVLTSSEEVSCGGRLADVNVGSDGMGRVLLLNVRKHRYMLPADLIAIPRIFNPDICLKLKSFFFYIHIISTIWELKPGSSFYVQQRILNTCWFISPIYFNTNRSVKFCQKYKLIHVCTNVLLNIMNQTVSQIFIRSNLRRGPAQPSIQPSSATWPNTNPSTL